MKSTTTLSGLISIVSLTTQGVTTTCYGFGDIRRNTETARSFVEHACYANGGMFTGNFNPRQTKSMCPRDGGLCYLFEIQNWNDHQGFDLGNDDCYNRSNNEIFGCLRDGQSTVSGWRFR